MSGAVRCVCITETSQNVDFLGSGGKNRSVSSLAYLAAVNIVIWIGLFFYVWRLDRRLTERERNR